jgi:hypothetical protein
MVSEKLMLTYNLSLLSTQIESCLLPVVTIKLQKIIQTDPLPLLHDELRTNSP